MAVKSVKIIISTRFNELISNRIADEIIYNNGSGISPDYDDDEYYEPETAISKPIITETEGIMSCDNGIINITYDESELTETKNTYTTITFDENRPWLVSIVRNGILNTTLVFDATAPRIISAYENSIHPFEIIIKTLKLTNSISYEEYGKLQIDYEIELYGIPAEKNIIKVKVLPVKDNFD